MLYIAYIMKTFNVSEETAQQVMDKMSIAGFRFSSASYEEIKEEASWTLHFMRMGSYSKDKAASLNKGMY